MHINSIFNLLDKNWHFNLKIRGVQSHCQAIFRVEHVNILSRCHLKPFNPQRSYKFYANHLGSFLETSWLGKILSKLYTFPSPNFCVLALLCLLRNLLSGLSLFLKDNFPKNPYFDFNFKKPHLQNISQTHHSLIVLTWPGGAHACQIFSSSQRLSL